LVQSTTLLVQVPILIVQRTILFVQSTTLLVQVPILFVSSDHKKDAYYTLHILI